MISTFFVRMPLWIERQPSAEVEKLEKTNRISLRWTMKEYEILRAIVISHKPNFNLFKISRYKKVLFMELKALVHFRK